MKYLIFILSLVEMPLWGISQNDSIYKKSVKLDILSLYNVFFDAKNEIRAGVEFERSINNKISSVIIFYFLN